MITIILIIYSLAAIVTAGITFCSICEVATDSDLWWLAILFSLLAGAILPIIGALIIIVSLLPIIIPCVTLIYLFG